jgi:NAD(P)-dependent dehydrogenase (short-subunit alcohol dehydrogenase family)
MDLQLKGKRALVTGGSGAIGSAIVEMLAREGVRVVVHGRRTEATRAVAARAGGPGNAAVVLGDLSDIAEAKRVAEEALVAFGGIDILINNAATTGPTNWNITKPEDWVQYFRMIVASAVTLSLALIPQMKERGWGRIIQTGSSAASLGLPSAPEYAASKAALANMSSSLAKEYGEYGITSNILGVGTVTTDTHLQYVAEAASKIAATRPDGKPVDRIYEAIIRSPGGFYNINPLQRMGRPEEVAYAAVMLASPLSSFINGALIRVDGGKVPTIGL